MILYHFTAKHLAKKIYKKGLTLGAIPISVDPPKIKTGYIWLTSNESFNQPSLMGTGRLNYKRNEVRITLVIPENKKQNLLKFDEHKYLTPLYDDLTMYGDPENWYVYKGIIPTGWFRKKTINKSLGL